MHEESKKLKSQLLKEQKVQLLLFFFFLFLFQHVLKNFIFQELQEAIAKLHDAKGKEKSKLWTYKKRLQDVNDQLQKNIS